MVIMPLGDIFITQFGLRADQFTYLVSAYSGAAFFSGLLGVFFLDVFDRKAALLFVYGGFTISTFACSLPDSYIPLLLLRLVNGFFGGILGAVLLSIISDLFPFKERGKAIGMLMAAFSAASALGVPFALYISADGNWQLPFKILGLCGIAVWLMIFFILPSLKTHLESIDDNRSVKNTLSTIFKDSNQVNALLAGFVIVLAHFCIIPFISPYLIKNVGLSQMEITYQFFFGGLATVISSPLIGRLVDKLGVMKVFITTMILSFIPTLLITNLNTVPLTIAISYTTLFFVFATGRMIAPNTIITAAATPRNRGSFMSFKSSLQQLAVTFAALISGQIVFINNDNLYQNYDYVGYLSIVLGLLSIYLVSRLKVAKGN